MFVLYLMNGLSFNLMEKTNPHTNPSFYPLLIPTERGIQGWGMDFKSNKKGSKKTYPASGLINQLPNIWSAHYFYWISFCTLFLKAWLGIDSAFKIKPITFITPWGLVYSLWIILMLWWEKIDHPSVESHVFPVTIYMSTDIAKKNHPYCTSELIINQQKNHLQKWNQLLETFRKA